MVEQPANAAAPTLTVLILTRDEALHIARAIASVATLANRVLVVDSGSTDDTVALARAAGADVLVNAWVNHAAQVNWALDHGGIASDWVLRLDADEIVLDADTIARFIATAPSQIVAATLNRRIHFQGRWLRHGGLYPVRTLRLWRQGHGRAESRLMDEHVAVDGEVATLAADFADINLRNIGWWTAKHNHYATLEAVQQLSGPAGETGGIGAEARRKRWLKNSVYARLPLGLRPLLYFLYRYIGRLGILDGWQGLAFHGLQGLWYRFLVDVKIAELRGLMRGRGHDLARVVADEYQLKL